MKISGFEMIDLQYGCFGLKCREEDVPLDRVLKERLASVYFRDELNQRSMDIWWVRKMTFRNCMQEVSFKGAVVYPSVDALILLLVKDLCVTGTDETDNYLRKLRELPEPRRTEQMREFLFKREYDWEKLKMDEPLASGFPAVHFKTLKNNHLIRQERDKEILYQLQAPAACSLLYRVERRIRIGGRRVPYWKYLYCPPGDGSPFAWNGRRLARLPFARPTRNDLAGLVGEGLVRDLDKRGVANMNVFHHYFPFADMRPEVVIRLPGKEERKELGELKLDRMPAPAKLDRPLFVRRAFDPVPLRRDLPLIDDPAQAMYFLSRLDGNQVFVPGDMLVSPEDHLEKEEFYYVGLKLDAYQPN